MITLDEIDSLLPRDKTIGVLVSGGFDSAVLWYAVKKICLERNQQCNPYTIPKLDGAEYHAKNVLQTTCNLLGIPEIETTMVGQFSEDPGEYTRSGVADVIRLGHEDFALTAVTAYFNDLIWHPAPEERKRPNDYQKKFMEQPFYYHTKDETVSFAKDLSILDAIMPVTHSCTQQSMSRCNQCYWCQERKMAFAKLELEDTGNI